MLKALKILEQAKIGYLNVYYTVKDINEAIAELEALMEKDKMKSCEDCYNKTNLAFKALKNRSCDKCKHYNKYILCPIFVEAVRRCEHYNKKVNELENFCCKLWESK